MYDDAAQLTITKVKRYGMIGLDDGTKSTSEIASEAAHAIIAMDERLLNAETLMISTVRNDDSWESVTYTVRVFEGMNIGQLGRVVRYKDFGHGRREDQVVYGPLVPVEKAEALLAVLNS